MDIIKDCKKCGGVGVPFYKGQTCCKVCSKENNKASWQAQKGHPEKNRARIAAWYAANTGKKKEYNAAWAKGHPDKMKAAGLRCNYGLTLEQHAQMLMEQNGKCAICSALLTMTPRGPHVDHCHITGKIRALLYGHCNSMLGFSRDSPAVLLKAAEYIKEHL